MQNRFGIITILAVVFSLFFACSLLHAGSLKDRMAARIPTINSLKAQGLVGENNAGYLEYRTGNKPKQALIKDENNDRKTVYKAIGKREGVSPSLVGQRRAKMISDKGKGGYWYQDANGKWHKK